MDSLLAVIVGIGLAASCGFHVFVPMLVVGVAFRAGYLEAAEGFAWLGSWPALLAFAVATVLEIAAFYVPWLDNLLDSIASPLAVVAGVVLFAATTGNIDPLLQWSLAVIAGGGSAAVVQGGTTVTRAASTTTTGGVANFALTTLETICGFVFSTLSIVVPVLAVILLLLVVIRMYYAGRSVIRGLLDRLTRAKS